MLASRISALLASWPLSGVSKDCASTVEKYGSLSTGDRKRVSFTSIDTQASGLALRATLLLGVAALMSALVTLGQSTSLEAIEATRLLHGFYVDESSAKRTWQICASASW